MEGGNLGVGRDKKAMVGFIMSEHTQLYLPSHLSESRAEEGRGDFLCCFRSVEGQRNAHGDANPV